jgi:transcriptional regulator with XRE-family HTH domain
VEKDFCKSKKINEVIVMLGDKIKQLRIDKEVQQKELANIMNVTVSAVSMWETNMRVPEVATLQRIAEYFGVTIDSLLGTNKQSVLPIPETKDEIIICFRCEGKGIRDSCFGWPSYGTEKCDECRGSGRLLKQTSYVAYKPEKAVKNDKN